MNIEYVILTEDHKCTNCGNVLYKGIKCLYDIDKQRNKAYKQAFDNAKLKAELFVKQTGKEIIGINKIVDGNYDIDRMEKNILSVTGEEIVMSTSPFLGEGGNIGALKRELLQQTTSMHREIRIELEELYR